MEPSLQSAQSPVSKQDRRAEQEQDKVYVSGLRFAGVMVAVCLAFTLVGIVSRPRTKPAAAARAVEIQ